MNKLALLLSGVLLFTAWLVSFELPVRLHIEQNLKVSEPTGFNQIDDMNFYCLLGSDLEVAIQVAWASLDHDQIVNFLVSWLHDFSRQVQLTV